MVLKLNTTKPALWRNLTDIQIGQTADSVQLEHVTVAQRKLIAALQKGFADDQLAYFADQSGLTEAETSTLMQKLEPALQTKLQPQAATRKLVATVEDSNFIQNSLAELMRIEANQNTSPIVQLAARGTRSVYVDSLGKTGLALTRILAAAGIGRVVSHDSRPILPADIGADGFEQSQQGQSRFTAVSNILSRNHLQTRVSNANRMSEGTLNRLDCAVLISQSVTAPMRYAIWARKRIPHLNITFGERYIDVSPVIFAGRNPCLGCLDLHRQSLDSAWPAIASQVMATNLRFDDTSSRSFAAGLAAKAVLIQLDSNALQGPDPGEPETLTPAASRGFRLDLIEHRVYEFTWPASAQCSCSCSF